ncbi:MAG: hypothetical protein EZS28_055743, partial [Streblomastix strix]
MQGTPQIRGIIHRPITQQALNKLKIREYGSYKDETKQLLCGLNDGDTMRELVKIRRVVERRSEERLVEFIKAGLMRLLNEVMEKALQEAEGEGKIIVIEEIIESLIEDNPEASRVIVEETDFFERYIPLLNQLPLP